MSLAALVPSVPGLLGIEIICRDRGDVYTQAARLGAPHAKQVADGGICLRMWAMSSSASWPAMLRYSSR